MAGRAVAPGCRGLETLMSYCETISKAQSLQKWVGIVQFLILNDSRWLTQS